MDELGRGTSTSDGASIAAAVLQHLTTVTKCRCVEQCLEFLSVTGPGAQFLSLAERYAIAIFMSILKSSQPPKKRQFECALACLQSPACLVTQEANNLIRSAVSIVLIDVRHLIQLEGLCKFVHVLTVECFSSSEQDRSAGAFY